MKTNKTQPETGKNSQTPKNIKTSTQLTSCDYAPSQCDRDGDGVSDCAVEEAVIGINPDVESMESRG